MSSRRNPHRQGLVTVAIIAAAAALIALVAALPDPNLDRSLLENWNPVGLVIAGITAALCVVAVIGWLVSAAVAWDLKSSTSRNRSEIAQSREPQRSADDEAEGSSGRARVSRDELTPEGPRNPQE